MSHSVGDNGGGRQRPPLFVWRRGARTSGGTTVSLRRGSPDTGLIRVPKVQNNRRFLRVAAPKSALGRSATAANDTTAVGPHGVKEESPTRDPGEDSCAPAPPPSFCDL
jgi:hypothetical protein